jgi:hypothetical protein
MFLEATLPGRPSKKRQGKELVLCDPLVMHVYWAALSVLESFCFSPATLNTLTLPPSHSTRIYLISLHARLEREIQHHAPRYQICGLPCDAVKWSDRRAGVGAFADNE